MSINTKLLNQMRKSLEEAFLYDFNTIIEEYDFYHSLSSKLQTNLANCLFNGFIRRFDNFFNGLETGFVNALVVNLFARKYEPGEVIIKPGQTVVNLMFVTEG
jgi:hypothetical protein